MITGQGLTYQLDEKKTESCEDFSFPGGVTYIPYAKKDVFSLLSLASVPFTAGSLSVDDVQLTPTGFSGGTAKVIKLDVAGTGSLFLVSFYKGSEEEANAAFTKLASELKALKFPSKTEESKKDKVKMLMTVLSLNPVSYILIDLNDPLVQENRLLWELAFLDYKGTAFFLSENPEKASRKAKDEKVPLKKALYLPYRIPLLLTSLFSIALCAYAQSEKIKGSSKWGLALAAAIVFAIANIVIGVFLAKKVINKNTKREVLNFFEIISALSNVIGIAIALLVAWLLSEKTSFLSSGVLKGSGLAMVTLVGVALLFAQFVIGHALLSYRLSKSKAASRSLESK
jgi:hypothetical protein